MRRLTGSFAIVVLGCALAGCTAGGPTTPTTGPVAISPSVAVPTSVVTLGSQWTPDEQGAIDAVQRYLEVWAQIGQGLPGSDVDRIRDVASDPIASHAIQVWELWQQKSWHLVGSPAFTPDTVTAGAIDSQGNRYYVYGCTVIEDSYVADVNNDPIPADDRVERGTDTFTVIQTSSDVFRVLDDKAGSESC